MLPTLCSERMWGNVLKEEEANSVALDSEALASVSGLPGAAGVRSGSIHKLHGKWKTRVLRQVFPE